MGKYKKNTAISVSEESYLLIKKHCNKNGLFIAKFVERCCSEKINSSDN